MASSAPLLAPKRGSTTHLVLTTVPLLIVLIYFLFEAWQRPSKPVYQIGDDVTDDQWQKAQDETGVLISLMDMMIVFLCLHICWTSFAVYIMSFVAKRRHLIGRYLTEGETTIGDVIYDKSSRTCGGFHDYGYVVYAHPTQPKVIKKRVRVYQQFTRERLAILRLPNRPLSGQAKTDLEMDLNAASKERDSQNKFIVVFALCWVVFTFLSPLFVLYQMNQIEDQKDDVSKGVRIFLSLAGLSIPFAYALNWVRFLFYRNWMVNRGAVVADDPDARKVQGCLNSAQSEDGSDIIPYSILNEEDMSYQGSLPSHSLQPPPEETTVNVLAPERKNSKPTPWVTLG